MKICLPILLSLLQLNLTELGYFWLQLIHLVNFAYFQTRFQLFKPFCNIIEIRVAANILPRFHYTTLGLDPVSSSPTQSYTMPCKLGCCLPYLPQKKLQNYGSCTNRSLTAEPFPQGGIKLCIRHPYCRTIAPQILSHGRIYMSDNTILAKKHGV